MDITQLKIDLDKLSKLLETTDSHLFNFKEYDKVMNKLKLTDLSEVSAEARVQLGEPYFRLIESIVNYDSLIKKIALRKTLRFY